MGRQDAVTSETRLGFGHRRNQRRHCADTETGGSRMCILYAAVVDVMGLPSEFYLEFYCQCLQLGKCRLSVGANIACTCEYFRTRPTSYPCRTRLWKFWIEMKNAIEELVSRTVRGTQLIITVAYAFTDYRAQGQPLSSESVIVDISSLCKQGNQSQ